jgi:hypothetical protein
MLTIKIDIQTSGDAMQEKYTLPDEAFQLGQVGKFNALRAEKITEHFTWGEVFMNCQNYEILNCPMHYFNNALIQADTMEKVREVFGVPIMVHCWYRDPLHNMQVKGKKGSYHLQALATDFHVQGYEGITGNLHVQHILEFKPFMESCGLEYTHGSWTHVDSRGYKARF